MAFSNPSQSDLIAGGMFSGMAERVAGIGKVRLVLDLTATTPSKHIFVADRAYTVASIQEIHSVVGGAGANCKLRRITDTTAPGAAASATCVELITAGLDLTTTINTVVTGTQATSTLNAGEKLSILMGGTLTGLVGTVTVVLEPA